VKEAIPPAMSIEKHYKDMYNIFICLIIDNLFISTLLPEEKGSLSFFLVGKKIK